MSGTSGRKRATSTHFGRKTPKTRSPTGGLEPLRLQSQPRGAPGESRNALRADTHAQVRVLQRSGFNLERLISNRRALMTQVAVVLDAREHAHVFLWGALRLRTRMRTRGACDYNCGYNYKYDYECDCDHRCGCPGPGATERPGDKASRANCGGQPAKRKESRRRSAIPRERKAVF